MAKTAPKPRVLIVDDEVAVLELLRERLRLEGFVCAAARSGDEAVQLIDRHRFDAVISDLRMPGLSGMALLERVVKQLPHCAFLMVTGESDVRIGIQAMQEGAADYLVKPFQLDAVVHSVRRALEKKRLEAELERYRARLEEMVEERTRQLQQALQEIEDTYASTLEALAAALDLRDSDTAGHSIRVTEYSLEIAKAMGCSEEELKQIGRGAALHDIGKIGIPDGILLKKDKLTPQERAVMETHARVGYELVSRIAFLAPAAEIVLTHQERYDGTGYPQGLRGEEIPLGARIFAVVDTLDAMTSDRPYRRAVPFHVAREEIARQAGKQFDPEVVRVFLSLPEQVWDKVRKRAARAADARGRTAIVA